MTRKHCRQSEETGSKMQVATTGVGTVEEWVPEVEDSSQCCNFAASQQYLPCNHTPHHIDQKAVELQQREGKALSVERFATEGRIVFDFPYLLPGLGSIELLWMGSVMANLGRGRNEQPRTGACVEPISSSLGTVGRRKKRMRDMIR